MAFLLNDVFYDGALIGRQRHVIYVVVAAISISKGTDCARRFEAVTRVLVHLISFVPEASTGSICGI